MTKVKPEAEVDNSANGVLERSKDKFKNVIVIGVHENGMPDLDATILTYPFIHWALNRTLFEINNHERSNIPSPNSE